MFRLMKVLCCTLVGAMVLLVPLAAEGPQPPPFYAIQNVRVVSGVGAPIEGATVVIGDGLIEAVGVGVKVPADAWVIDGEGLTLYPGLIDSMTTLGQKQEESSDGDGGVEVDLVAGIPDHRSEAPKIAHRRPPG